MTKAAEIAWHMITDRMNIRCRGGPYDIGTERQSTDQQTVMSTINSARRTNTDSKLMDVTFRLLFAWALTASDYLPVPKPPISYALVPMLQSMVSDQTVPFFPCQQHILPSGGPDRTSTCLYISFHIRITHSTAYRIDKPCRLVVFLKLRIFAQRAISR